ncbi:MAG TPA: NosD domain-containing protein [Pyrinomonadaceae bacterium]|jgi:hypothetical protein
MERIYNMKRLGHVLTPLAVLALILIASTLAQAQATRTWVSGVGDDSNPCSRTAPCLTFAGAIMKTNVGGEINALDPGGFGSVTINQSVTIDGGEGFAGILTLPGTTAIIVNLTTSIANDPEQRVVLRRLSINGTGQCGVGCGLSLGTRAINATSFKTLDVEHCFIQNFTTAGINVSLTTSGSRMSVKDTNINNTGIGIQMTTTGTFGVSGTFDKLRIDNCASGVIARDRAFITIRDSVVQACSTVGVSIQAPSNVAALILENVMLYSVNTGVQAGTLGTNVDLSNTSIMYNSVGISSGGGAVNSHQNNRIAYNTSAGVVPTPVGQQ